MNRYVVEIKEVLKRTILVNAETEEEAREIIQRDYALEKIVLGSEDYESTDIEVIGKI